MKESKITHYLALFFVFTLSSCNKENSCDCFKSTGEITTETRTVSGFNKIYIEDNINLYISIDSTYSLSIEAGSHIQSLIKTEVTDSCLYLKNENKCNWVRSYKKKINAYLTCKSIQDINYNSASGNIYTLDTIHSDFFQVDDYGGSGEINLLLVSKNSFFRNHTGPADIIVKGKSQNTYIYSAGNGLIDLKKYPSDYVVVSNFSTNNCFTNVNKELDVTIGSLGDIYYTGNPYSIKTNITGSGKLIKY